MENEKKYNVVTIAHTVPWSRWAKSSKRQL